jgi:mannose/cellobiose epimerase-like protein (N-acyl-D-glucosamine 2-epimerase family)
LILHEKPIVFDRQEKRADAQGWLFDAALPLWRAQGFNATTGMFLERLGQDATADLGTTRMRVQARQTYSFALAGRMGWDGDWRTPVEAGWASLQTRLRGPNRGFVHKLSALGQILDDRADLYDFAFAYLALAQAGQALNRCDQLIRSTDYAFSTLETWTHPLGGFYEGDVDPQPPRRQNPHMHLLEAAMAMADATSDQRWIDLQNHLGNLFRDRLFHSETGTLAEFYNDDLSLPTDQSLPIVEPGHLFEWIWLLDAWRLRGGPDVSDIQARLWTAATRDGFNAISGFPIEQMDQNGHAIKTSARLWPSTEFLKAASCLDRQGHDDATVRLTAAFKALQRWFATPLQGLWFDKANDKGAFLDEPAPASTLYHIILALCEFGWPDLLAPPKVKV